MRGDAISARPAGRRQVDRTALRVNQAFIIGFLALAFLFDQPCGDLGPGPEVELAENVGHMTLGRRQCNDQRFVVLGVSS